MSTLIATTSIEPPSESAVAADFPWLGIAENPSPSRFVCWLRDVMVAFDGWGPPEPDDPTQYGTFVRQAGEVASYLGFADLYDDSTKVAPKLPTEVFGASEPACSKDEAYSFFAKCIAKGVESGAKAQTASKQKSKAALIQKPLQQRYLHVLEWEKHARVKLGNRASDQAVYDWARSRRKDFDLKLPDTFKTFERYLRAGRKWRNDGIAKVMKLPSDE